MLYTFRRRITKGGESDAQTVEIPIRELVAPARKPRGIQPPCVTLHADHTLLSQQMFDDLESADIRCSVVRAEERWPFAEFGSVRFYKQDGVGRLIKALRSVDEAFLPDSKKIAGAWEPLHPTEVAWIKQQVELQREAARERLVRIQRGESLEDALELKE